jgi:hypothetical protein
VRATPPALSLPWKHCATGVSVTPQHSPWETFHCCRCERNAPTFVVIGVSATPRFFPWETLRCYRRECNTPIFSLWSTSLPVRAHAGEGGALSHRSSTRASTSASTAGGMDEGMAARFRASETLPLWHDRLCARCNNIVRFRSCADDLVGVASNYGEAIQSFKDQGVHNLAYVRTLLTPGSREV